MKTIPFDIPSNWTWATMGEIADVVGGGTPRTNDPENYEGGTIPWITPADLSGYTAKNISRGKRFITTKGLAGSSVRMMPSGTVLFSSRAPVGYVAIAANPVCTNQGFKSFLLKSKDILPDYLYWWLKGSKELAESLASGTTFLELSGAKAKQLPIPLAPPRQQQSIVAEIEKQFSRLDEAIANLKRVRANLKRYKAAVLKAAVEGKLTEDWRKQHPNIEPASKLLERILTERRSKWKGRGKYKEPTAPDFNDLPSLPKGWTWATVDQLGAPEPNSITDGPFGSNLKTEHYKETGPRVIRLQNIGDGVFVNEEAHISEEHFARLQKHRVFADDLVIAALGVDPPRSCLIPKSVRHAIVKADCVRFKPHRDAVARYLNVALNSEPTRQRTKSIVHGVGRPRLNLGEIKSIVVPLPPFAEQQSIVAEVERRLSVIDELEAAVEANIIRADRLRQSILSAAFSGRLAVSESEIARRANNFIAH